MCDFELVDCGKYGISVREKLKENEYYYGERLDKVNKRFQLKKLNSEAFTYDYHTFDNSTIKADKVVGYCESERVLIRPQKNHYAIMFFEEDIGYYWFHIWDFVFDKLFIKEQL